MVYLYHPNKLKRTMTRPSVRSPMWATLKQCFEHSVKSPMSQALQSWVEITSRQKKADFDFWFVKCLSRKHRYFFLLKNFNPRHVDVVWHKYLPRSTVISFLVCLFKISNHKGMLPYADRKRPYRLKFSTGGNPPNFYEKYRYNLYIISFIRLLSL